MAFPHLRPVAERLAGRVLSIARLAIASTCAGALAAAGRPLLPF